MSEAIENTDANEAMDIIREVLPLLERVENYKEVLKLTEAYLRHPDIETDKDIEARILERFEVIAMLVKACMASEARSLIVSGPPGTGKSYTVESTLGVKDEDGNNGFDSGIYSITKGYMRATGLFRQLYNHRFPGQVLVLDDCDAVFGDETALNILKTACDTTKERWITWGSEKEFIDEDTGEQLPTKYLFEGAMIFLTNYDFEDIIARGHKYSKHIEAMVSRSHYISLGMRNRKDYLVRINQVVREGMLGHLNEEERVDVMRFINDNAGRLREISLRLAVKVADLRRANPKNWSRIAEVTCLRGY